MPFAICDYQFTISDYRMHRQSDRLSRLPLYAVAEINAIKRRLQDEGRDVIDLSAGDADMPPPEIAVRTLVEALEDSAMSRYGFQLGLREFRESVVAYMSRRFGVAVDPVTEVLPLIGSKEGLAHLAMAVLDPGDVCVVPDPGYPAYTGGATLADADIEYYPLTPEEGFLVELETIDAKRLARTRLAFLNYPNNPTAAVAPRDYLERTVATCHERNIVLAYDNPYCELGYDDYVAPSILEVEGARDVALEFHSFSKSFCMTGWRLGWAVGNADLIAALQRTKTYVDTGPFLALQKAGAAVLDRAEECVAPVLNVFARRRAALLEALRTAGIEVQAPAAAIYLWVKLPDGVQTATFAKELLEREAVAVLAGTALGEGGEGFIRLALTVDESRLSEAAGKIAMAIERHRMAGAQS